LSSSAAIRRRESLVNWSKDIPMTASAPVRDVPSSSVMASSGGGPITGGHDRVEYLVAALERGEKGVGDGAAGDGSVLVGHLSRVNARCS